jgi:Holliday junction DNA helicase RuvA
VIASLRGTVIAVRDQTCTIDVQGVGYAVHVTTQLRRTLTVGQDAMLLTALIVREDSMTLFGFDTAESLELFDALIGVSGVGPRSALAILSELTPAEALTAVLSEDDAPFRKVSGIGPKTAKLIVVQLAGKLTALAAMTPVTTVTAAATGVGESVVAALVGLGWNEKIARDAVASVNAIQSGTSSADLLKAALAVLSKVSS